MIKKDFIFDLQRFVTIDSEETDTEIYGTDEADLIRYRGTLYSQYYGSHVTNAINLSDAVIKAHRINITAISLKESITS